MRRLLDAGHAAMLVWALAGNPARGFYEALGGQLVATKTVALGGVGLEEVAYGWTDLMAFARHIAQSL